MSRWSSLSLRTKGIVVVALPLVPLMGTLGLLLEIRSIEEGIEARVEHVRDVQVHANRLLTAALDAETGMRGYLIAEDDTFLEPYERAVQRLPSDVEELRAHAEPHDLAWVDEMERLISEQLDILARLRVSEEAGFAEGSPAERRQRALLARGKDLMDQLRVLIDEQIDHEEKALAEARAAEERSREHLERAALGGVVIGGLGGLISVLLLRGIVTGVRRAAVNARRLADQEPPLPGARRGDEIGALTASLEDAYGRLAEQAEKRAAAEDAVRAANAASEQKVADRTRDLEEARLEILRRLAIAAEYRDDDTHEHTQRVAETTALLATALNVAVEEVEVLKLAAPLHDIGKIGIPDSILLKPGPLTEEEFEIMKGHAEIGANILSGSRGPALAAGEVIAASHHERWDGTGYPRGLRGEDIPLYGRIVAVADVLDALTHERPYKSAWSLEEALAEIERQRGKHFDPDVVDALMRYVRRGPMSAP